jgi:hypothetical protein
MRRSSGVWLARVGVSALMSLAALGVSGCGPVQSTAMISEAEVALEKARVVKAEQLAPYEYWSANEYLYKAREEWGYADFEASMDYATLSRKFAEEALKKTKEAPYTGSPAGPRRVQDPEADALERY